MTKVLPANWQLVRLGNVLRRRSDTILPANMEEAQTLLVGLEDIEDGGRGGIHPRLVATTEIDSLKTRFSPGNILYGKLRPYLNKVGIVEAEGICSTEIWVFDPSPHLNSFFAYCYLSSTGFVERVSSLTKGANLPRLDAESFDSLEIPLPPLSEQHRIVEILREAEEIRRLSAQAEAKTAELIPALFHARFGGDSKIKFAKLETVADVVSGVAIGRKIKGTSQEVPYMRVANVQDGYIDLSEIKTTIASLEEILAYGLEPDDVLLTEGGDFDKLGRGCLWKGQVHPCIHQNHVFRVRPNPKVLNSHFFTHYLQSPRAKGYFLRCAKKTTNLASINISQLKALPVPAISLRKQEEFEREIILAQECLDPRCAQLANLLITSLSAHAFSGELTASWREAHAATLATEALERDAALVTAGAATTRSRRATVSELDSIFAERTDGIYSELTREQRKVLKSLKAFNKVSQPDYFTAKMVAELLDYPLRRNAQVVDGHLQVLATRGLLIATSREEQNEMTGEYQYANAYRLPLSDFQPQEGDPREPRMGDRSRATELERLIARIEKERMMP
jgi:type I restriction enzyme S subunit